MSATSCLEGRRNEPIWCDTRVRVLTVNTTSYASIRSILETGLDRVPPEPEPRRPMPQYQHLRGPGYCT